MQLAERTSDGAVASGYLHKYRSHAESSLWANTWEVRFVVLKGLRLSYYRKEQDVQYPPRGQIDLQVGRGDCVCLERGRLGVCL